MITSTIQPSTQFSVGDEVTSLFIHSLFSQRLLTSSPTPIEKSFRKFRCPGSSPAQVQGQSKTHGKNLFCVGDEVTSLIIHSLFSQRLLTSSPTPIEKSFHKFRCPGSSPAQVQGQSKTHGKNLFCVGDEVTSLIIHSLFSQRLLTPSPTPIEKSFHKFGYPASSPAQVQRQSKTHGKNLFCVGDEVTSLIIRFSFNQSLLTSTATIIGFHTRRSNP
jgi:uncharacterized protein (UPF0218 family)